MIPAIGETCLQLMLLTALLQSAGLFGKWKRYVSAATVITALLATAAFFLLVYSFAVSDFSVELVAEHSHTAKPFIYKISGTWGNHEGSILLYTWYLALLGAVYLFWAMGRKSAFALRVLGGQGALVFGFAAFTLFTSNPFTRLSPVPYEGNGLNPLLQDIGLALHPPMLYAGYVVFSLALTYALAGLLKPQSPKQWARELRPWVQAAWVLLTIGITLGSWWAYRELGWGGFWFWDPVENASLLPWLAGTALIHSLRVVEVQQAQVRWSFLLAILTFALGLIGFFLVRSGVLTSVHSFALDPNRGFGILLLLVASVGGGFTLFALYGYRLKNRSAYALTSREGFLLLNNLLMITLCFTVLLGTLYPLFMQAFALGRISVGAPYFNATFNPVAAITLMLAAIGGFMAWGNDSLKRHRLQLLAPMLFALAVTVLYSGFHSFIGILTLFGALWLFASVVTMLIAKRKTLRNLPRSFWPMWVAHLGISVVALSLVLHFALKTQHEQSMQPGEQISFAGFDLRLQDVKAIAGDNYFARQGHFTAQHGSRVYDLYPQTRFYPVENQQTTETAIASLWKGDFYLVIGDKGASGYAVRIYWRPAMLGIWGGAALVAFGGALALWVRRKK